jgi:hypothetical protein
MFGTNCYSYSTMILSTYLSLITTHTHLNVSFSPNLRKYFLKTKFPKTLAQDDWQILKYIRSQAQFLQRPSSKPYNLKNPDVDPSMGQSTVVKKIFKNMVPTAIVFVKWFSRLPKSNNYF